MTEQQNITALNCVTCNVDVGYETTDWNEDSISVACNTCNWGLLSQCAECVKCEIPFDLSTVGKWSTVFDSKDVCVKKIFECHKCSCRKYDKSTCDICLYIPEKHDPIMMAEATGLPSHYFRKKSYPLNNCVSCRAKVASIIVFKCDLCKKDWGQCGDCVKQKNVFDCDSLGRSSVKLYYDIDGVMEKCVCNKCFKRLKNASIKDNGDCIEIYQPEIHDQMAADMLGVSLEKWRRDYA